VLFSAPIGALRLSLPGFHIELGGVNLNFFDLDSSVVFGPSLVILSFLLGEGVLLQVVALLQKALPRHR